MGQPGLGGLLVSFGDALGGEYLAQPACWLCICFTIPLCMR
jgi:hypothetical protein